MKKPIILTALCLILTFSFFGIQTNAEPEIRYLVLPSDSMPMGILYDNSTVYVALYWSGQLAVINTSSLTYELYDVPSWYEGFIGPNPFQLARDTDGNIWISVDGFRSNPGGELPQDYWYHLVKFIIQNNTFQLLPLPVKYGVRAISFYNGFIWYGGLNVTGGQCNYYLLKMDSSTNQVVNVYDLGTIGDLTYIYGLDDCLWMSDGMNDKVYVLNITSSNIISIISGFDRPFGITSGENYLYVAENSRITGISGTIAKIDKVSYAIVERIETTMVTIEGPYHVMFDSYNNLWWTDNSFHIGVISPIESKVYPSKEYCYFMTEILGNTIWFSCVGSAYIGMVNTPSDMQIDINKLDLNNDGIVDYIDISRVCRAYGSVLGQQRWDSDADFNVDGIIDYIDISMVARCFGKKTEL